MNGGVSARGQETLKRHLRKMTVGPRDCQALQKKEDTAQRRALGAQTQGGNLATESLF